MREFISRSFHPWNLSYDRSGWNSWLSGSRVPAHELLTALTTQLPRGEDDNSCAFGVQGLGEGSTVAMALEASTPALFLPSVSSAGPRLWLSERLCCGFHI